MKTLMKSAFSRISPTLSRKYDLWNYKRKALPQEFVEHIKNLKPSDLVIDVGANIGLVTECLAKTRAQVIALEPNVKALDKLMLVSSRYKNVKVIPAAAGTKNCSSKLFLHRDSEKQNTDLTQASSLLSEKPNVSPEIFNTVKVIDFSEYLTSLDKPIELLKIDIEGYEIELINHLLDKNSLSKVNKVYLETHEKKFTSLGPATQKLKQRVIDEGLAEKFYYEWH